MELTPIFVCAVVFFGLYKTIELFVRRRERLTIIDKITEMSASRFDRSIIDLLNSGDRIKFSALKVGSCAMGIGLGCFLGAMMLVVLPPNIRWHVMSSVFSGLVVFFGGLGLVLGFVIEKRLRSHKTDEKRSCETESE